MKSHITHSWSEFRPLLSDPSRRDFLAYARLLSRLSKKEAYERVVNDVRTTFIRDMGACRRSDRQQLLAAGLVLTDLVMQGWQIRLRQGILKIRPQAQRNDDHAAEKNRIRRQELLKRDAQLRKPAVRDFITSMEKARLFNGTFVSIFSLMRDGRALAEDLRKARQQHNSGFVENSVSTIDPYLQIVTSEALCPFTGLRLIDIWRYFRHTWTNQYNGVPGRSMMYLVRDRAVPFHPIIGIGALSSPVMQIRQRDMWIGWHPESFLAQVRTSPTSRLASWLINTVDKAISEIYVADFLEDGILCARDLTDPNDSIIRLLLKESVQQRCLHHRYARSRDHKYRSHLVSDLEHWETRAKTHLFRSKRALALASYLEARKVFKASFGRCPTAQKLAVLATTSHGSDVIRKILKKAKADRVGIAVADITVCGAIQPYNAVLGGKLVAMLSTSPEIVLEYRRRYSKAASEIASSMAGRMIIRPPMLVLLGTTSLYGIGSSQYNRIVIPCDRLGGSRLEAIRYEELGRSESFGTSQYSEETIDALADVVHQSAGGQRVNSIFGEGVSPKLRKVRHALEILGLSSEVLLRHHRKRVVYGTRLIRNMQEYLLGLDQTPNYLVPLVSGDKVTSQIVAWWRERWLFNRIKSDEVLADVARHTLVRPIRHGARVSSQHVLEAQCLPHDLRCLLSRLLIRPHRLH